jgi:serine/threonine protein kinase
VEDEVKFPEYIDVSDEAKSFILGIMQKNPDDRMVMKDIFKHQFIRKYINQRKLAPEIVEEFNRVLK